MQKQKVQKKKQKKYNYIFADTDLNAMNFWVQLGVNIKARRMISAKVIPNL